MADNAEKFQKSNFLVLRALLHDFINPLTVVISATDVCLADPNMPPEVMQRFLERIRSASLEQKNAVEWIRSARSFFVGDKVKSSVVNLREMVDSLGGQLQESSQGSTSPSFQWHSSETGIEPRVKLPPEAFMHLVLRPLIAGIAETADSGLVDVHWRRGSRGRGGVLEFHVPGGDGLKLRNRMNVKFRALSPQFSEGLPAVSLPVAKLWMEHHGGEIKVLTRHKASGQNPWVVQLRLPARSHV